MSERIRLTISVTPEAHEIFSRMAVSMGVSLGRCMGDWLSDTSEGAQFVAQKVEDAKRSPMTVMRELQSMANGLGEAIQGKADEWRKASGTGRGDPAVRGVAASSGRRMPLDPPLSNTGGKVLRKGGKS